MVVRWVSSAVVSLALVAPSWARQEPAAAWTDPSPHEVGFLTQDGDTRLEFLDWGGSGEPILFLAGGGSSAHYFDDFAPHFTDELRVLGLTRRGHGASDDAS